jgi:magnesium transporter
MITFHPPGEKGTECTDLGHCHAFMRKSVWIDLHEPTEQEEIIVDMAFSIDLPTHREMQEIEVSRRLYKADDALFMTATILTNSDTNQPESSAVTFIFADNRLITLRYATPQPFVTFRAERESDLARYDSGQRILEGLIEAIIERIADLLENVGAALDNISSEIFRPAGSSQTQKANGRESEKAESKPRNLEQVLLRLGRCSDLVSRLRDSLVGLGRLLSFFTAAQKNLPPDLAEHLRTLSHDLGPLSDHASFLSGKVNFLLDATLGLINIEQNAIIKIFTIAAVLALPPTLVGTIYGMNFETIPELHWAIGYPFAVLLMILSAIMPYYYFKRRGWF